MKKSLLFLSFFVSVNASVYCQIDKNGDSIKTKAVTQSLVKSSVVIQNEIVTVDSTRALSEINTSTQAEAYPWISDDGLRLYYTEGGEIYYTERNSLTEKFTNAAPLAINSATYTNISCWLTHDELHIFYVIEESDGTHDRSLYHASRTAKTEAFNSPNLVTLNGYTAGLIAGPSLTSDLSQLYLYTQNLTYIFIKTSSDNYMVSDTLSVSGYNLDPGQLSADGLQYIFAFSNNGIAFNNSKIYSYKRASVFEKFNDLYYLKNDSINDSISNNGQPSISANNKILVYTKYNDGSWSGDDLAIAYINSFETSLVKVSDDMENISLYPNPATNTLTIDFKSLQNVNIENVSIYSSIGNVIESCDVHSKKNSVCISVRNYPSGIYFCTIKTDKGIINGGSFVIAK